MINMDSQADKCTLVDTSPLLLPILQVPPECRLDPGPVFKKKKPP